MTMTADIGKPERAKHISLRRVLPRLVKDPIAGFEEIGVAAEGQIVQLDLGLFRPYLVTRPEHVQRVLRDNKENYVRDGMFWKPLRRLLGNGILGYGARWQASRRTLQPLFTAKHVNSLMGQLADAVLDAVDQFEPSARSGQPLDAAAEMTRIVHRTVSRVFFGDRISQANLDRLAPAIDTAAESSTARMLLPFVPLAVPVPGDRAFRRSVRTIEDVMMPVIREARKQANKGDVVSTLCHARRDDGSALTDAEVGDDVVAMFAAGTETTAVTLAWLWVALKDHPDVAGRLYEEIDRVVGTGRVEPSHVHELRYTRMVLQELQRLYPTGWIVPRQAIQDDVIDGVRIRAGATMLLSPYLTHRMPWLWDSPHTFDPERFAPGREAKRHRYSYFPFGGGPHQCLGQHVFTAEAQIVVAAILSKYRLLVVNEAAVTPKPAASLRPRQRIEIVLRPRSAS